MILIIVTDDQVGRILKDIKLQKNLIISQVNELLNYCTQIDEALPTLFDDD